MNLGGKPEQSYKLEALCFQPEIVLKKTCVFFFWLNINQCLAPQFTKRSSVLAQFKPGQLLNVSERDLCKCESGN